MKTIYVTVVMALLSLSTVFGQSKTENIKVSGNCGMCENRIEKAVKAVDGVESADWDKTSKMLKVVFDESKTNSGAIHKAIAAVGHDTEKVKAIDSVYNALPGCCHYRE